MEILSMLSGPVVGAVIGYFTNYVAVKMLFHPKNPIRIGKYTLPFTPGIIPKRKKELAKAVGRAVEDELFGEKEVKEILLTDGTREVVIDGILGQMEGVLNSQQSVEQMISIFTGEEVYEEKKELLEEVLSDKIVQGVCSMDIGQIIADKGMSLMGESMNNPLLVMFITPELIQSIAAPIGAEVVSWVETDGKEKIQDYVKSEVACLEQKRPEELLGDPEKYMPAMKEKLQEIYKHFVENYADEVARQFPVREMIESRIAGMSNDALEELVLSVMKHELGMIVNLGALIGAVIGIVNIFI